LRYRNDNVGDEVVIFSAKGLVVGNPHVHALDEDDGTGAAPIEDVEAWRQAQPTFARRG
jgi:hypothetical protein